MSETSSRVAVPRLPVMSWQTFDGARRATLPCLLDQPGVQFTTSGRASILLAMESIGLQAGDKVLVPTYHCPTMIAPVEAVGAQPMFYPIDHSGAPDHDWLKRHPLDDVKVILAAHYFGLPQPMQALREWCDANGIALIEDCAHALFGVSGSRPVGKWGDIAIGSLTKFLPVPEGGCLLYNRPHQSSLNLTAASVTAQVKAIVDVVHVAASFRRLNGLNQLLLGAFSMRNWLKQRLEKSKAQQTPTDRGEQDMDGFSIDEALSHRSLTWASAWISWRAPRARIVERRRRQFNAFARLLTGFEGFHPLFTELPAGAAPYVFPLWVANPDPGYTTLRQLDFPVSRWDRLWPQAIAFENDAGPQWSHHILQLACHQDLSDEDIQSMADTVIRLYANPTTP